MTPAGFEPAHPKIDELKSSALDHSAMVSEMVFIVSDHLERAVSRGY